jgi:hypothetical protein
MLSDKSQRCERYLLHVWRFALALVLTLGVTPAHAAVSKDGAQGQTLTISQSSVSGRKTVTVSGRGFDETVGIYLAFCKLPKSGAAPSPCGGGKNLAGIGDASFWISSNPPPYGANLAIAYLPGGRFSEEVTISERIGKVDCRKTKCAITVRADHLREGDRTHDIFIPIKFTSKKK